MLAEAVSPGGGGGSEAVEPLNLAQLGRQICQECIVARCQRYGQFSKKMRLLLLSSGEGGGDGLPQSLTAIMTAVRYLQSAHPNVYGSCSSRLRVTMSSDAAVRQAFSRIVDELLLVSPAVSNGVTTSAGAGGHGSCAADGKSSSSSSSGGGSSSAIMTWGRLVSTIAVCCALSADCVLQGHPELVLVVLDCFEEACEERAVYAWLSSVGGWDGVASIIRAASIVETSRSRGRTRVWTAAALCATARLGAVNALLLQMRRRHPFLIGFAVASCVASVLAAMLSTVGPMAMHR